MRRTFLFLVLFAATLPAVAAEPLGKLARMVGTVKARPGQERFEDMPDMRVGEQVDAGMEVWAVAKSAAKIALGIKKCVGAVTLGPNSRFRFGPAVPQPDRFDFKLDVGQIRLAFAPRSDDAAAQALLGVESHEVQIDTPTAHINIHGSDVYVSVDAVTGITRVYVQEGTAEVTAVRATVRGHATVQVQAHTMTVAADDGLPPTQPKPINGPVPPVFLQPGDVLPPDPLLDLKSPILDLPR